jgi:hypothetical protein
VDICEEFLHEKKLNHCAFSKGLSIEIKKLNICPQTNKKYLVTEIAKFFSRLRVK